MKRVQQLTPKQANTENQIRSSALERSDIIRHGQRWGQLRLKVTLERSVPSKLPGGGGGGFGILYCAQTFTLDVGGVILDANDET